MASKPPSPLQLIGIGTSIAVLVIGGMVLGWIIDAQTNTFPIFTLVGLAAGIAGATGQLIAMFRKFKQD